MRSQAEMMEPFLAVAFALALLLSAMVVSGFVGLAEANPGFVEGVNYPPPNAVPIVISVSSPVNACLYGTSNITFAFNATSLRTSLDCITSFRCTADWLPKDMYAYQLDKTRPVGLVVIEYEETYQVPDGNHSLILEAFGPGYSFDDSTQIAYFFDMTTNVTVNFTVDTTAPSCSMLSPQNKTYDTANVALNFTVSEAASQISHVLDGGENMTVEGTVTLTGLSNGEHNVTVYAIDLAGNVGVSETVYFNVEVPEPFPATPVAASVVTVAVVCAVLLVYFKKHNHKSEWL